MKIRKVLIGAVLVMIGAPVALVLIAVVSISVLGSDQRHNRLLGRGARIPALCPTELRERQADAARPQHARRCDMAGPVKEPEPVEPAGR
jgi:hypothetical protein